jgi:multiple sugar transport system ATP-binding protein
MSIVLQHLEKRFPGGCRAVCDLSLEVGDGELFALVGPSGCGKTTTLRMIAGLERPSGGQITLDGRAIDHLAPKDRNLAMVFQNSALYPHLSVAENLAFPLKLRRMPAAEIAAKVHRAATLLGITSLLDRRPGQLSGGERQRTALGRAIVRQPACFLFDEPLSSLDPHLRAEMRLELRRLHGELATTSLYVTHDQEEALTLGHRVAVIERGRLQQVGPPLEVYRHPANRFVAAFLGRPPMNFLEGTLIGSAGKLWLQRTPHAPREDARYAPPDDARHAERDEYDSAAGKLRIALPAWAVAGLSGRQGQPLVLGVRPEDLLPSPDASRPTAALAAIVQQVERLGDRTHVYLSAGGQRLVASRSTRSLAEVGTAVQVHVDLNRLHFFAPDDPPAARWGENLCLDCEPDS